MQKVERESKRARVLTIYLTYRELFFASKNADQIGSRKGGKVCEDYWNWKYHKSNKKGRHHKRKMTASACKPCIIILTSMVRPSMIS